jgi:hypothetical protein
VLSAIAQVYMYMYAHMCMYVLVHQYHHSLHKELDNTVHIGAELLAPSPACATGSAPTRRVVLNS